MDYQKLAQDIVACGVGRHVTEGIWDYWCIEDHITDVNKARTAEEFCKDGRVCLAMIELRCSEEDVDFSCGMQYGKWWAAIEDFGKIHFEGDSESLPVAINQACVAAIKGE